MGDERKQRAFQERNKIFVRFLVGFGDRVKGAVHDFRLKVGGSMVES